jgi:hypothetical protein
MSEDFKIFVEDFTDWLNSQEAGIVKLKTQIQKVLGETKPSPKLPFDASKIQWQDKESGKGKFQLSEDYNSLDHKALLKFLNEHAGGCVASEDHFYWVFQNGATIGRKLRK